MPTPVRTAPTGGLRLFRLFGIQVSLHWSWFLVAYWEIQTRKGSYRSPVWMVAEYVTLFAIVLMHEFGHALACRSVGGQAERIMLWPLGGVAFVSPPQRPGAYLWSIAAGPLVNLVLLPFTILAVLYLAPQLSRDAAHFVRAIAYINGGLLIFNLLPIYPLDGGQILRSLLWFVLGAVRSLMVASVIGLIGAAAAVLLAAWIRDYWLILLAVFGAFQSWSGFTQARKLREMASIPRWPGFTCPSCGAHPPAVPLWACARCGCRFDTFAHYATCPQCGAQFDQTLCPDCGQSAPLDTWRWTPAPASGASPFLAPAPSAYPTLDSAPAPPRPPQ